MRIVHLVTQMEAGGAQAIAVVLAKGFSAQQHRSDVWFLYRKTGFHEDEGNVYYFFDRLPGVWRLPWLMLMLVRKLRQERVDALYCHTHYANIIGAVAARIAGVRYVVAVHTAPYNTYPVVAGWIDRCLGYWGFYDTAVCVSSVVHDSMRPVSSRYRQRCCLIPNGVELPGPVIGKAAACEILGINPDEGLLLSVGRLYESKNHQFLVSVMAQMPAANLRLVILGDGEYRDSLAQAVITQGQEARVVLAGEAAPERVVQWLSAADAFVFASQYEAFGLAVVEAMQAGLPVICSDIPAMHEVVGDAGVILPLQVTLWVEALQALLADPARQASLSQAALARGQLFSAKEMVGAYLRLLDESQAP